MKTMPLSELILRASKKSHGLTPSYFLSPNENYYMRSMGDDVKSTAGRDYFLLFYLIQIFLDSSHLAWRKI